MSEYEETAFHIARRWACQPEDVDPMQRDIAAAIREAEERGRQKERMRIALKAVRRHANTLAGKE